MKETLYKFDCFSKKKTVGDQQVAEAYSEPSQTSMMEFFAKIVKVESH